jgi:hypothetical protein
MAKTKTEIKAHFEKTNASQERMLASMHAFGEKLDRMNAAFKTCLKKREAKIKTGLK